MSPFFKNRLVLQPILHPYLHPILHPVLHPGLHPVGVDNWQ